MIWSWRSNNFGDRIGPYLLRRMGIFWQGRLLTTGSIGHRAVGGDTVWGSGLLRPSWVPESKSIRFLLVRGPLTRVALGLKCPVGEPGLLVSRYFSSEKCVGKVGYIPHHAQVGCGISPVLPVEKFIGEICGCEMVFSASLYGLVVADALGIPCQQVYWAGEQPSSFKFRDYYLATGRQYRKPMSVKVVKDCYWWVPPVFSGEEMLGSLLDRRILAL